MTLDVRPIRMAGLPGLEVVGEVDHSNVGSLRSALLEVVAGGAPHVVLDLTHLTYLDSAGISCLYAALEAFSGGWIGVLNPAPSTLRILTLAGLPNQPRFLVFSDRDRLQAAAARVSGGE